jgi:hypothetical protein
LARICIGGIVFLPIVVAHIPIIIGVVKTVRIIGVIRIIRPPSMMESVTIEVMAAKVTIAYANPASGIARETPTSAHAGVTAIVANAGADASPDGTRSESGGMRSEPRGVWSRTATGGMTSAMLCPRRERKQNQIKRRYAKPAPHNHIIAEICLLSSLQKTQRRFFEVQVCPVTPVSLCSLW